MLGRPITSDKLAQKIRPTALKRPATPTSAAALCAEAPPISCIKGAATLTSAMPQLILMHSITHKHKE